MRDLVVALSLLGTIGFFERVASDPHPQLAGHWIQDTPPPSPSTPVGPTCGLECVITQDEKTLTVKRQQSGDSIVFTLDGTPTTTTSTFGPYSSDMTVTAQWDRAVLLITRKTGPVGQSPTIVTTNRFSILEGRLAIESNGTGRGGDETKFIYRLAK